MRAQQDMTVREACPTISLCYFSNRIVPVEAILQSEADMAVQMNWPDTANLPARFSR